MNCISCRFWGSRDERITKETNDEVVYRACRRFPPSIDDDKCKGTQFPVVEARQWCGEWQLKK